MADRAPPETRRNTVRRVMVACLRQSMFPKMMEHLQVSNGDALDESLRMVDETAIYFGVFAHRYGYAPKGHDTSVIERNITPRSNATSQAWMVSQTERGKA